MVECILIHTKDAMFCFRPAPAGNETHHSQPIFKWPAHKQPPSDLFQLMLLDSATAAPRDPHALLFVLLGARGVIGHEVTRTSYRNTG